MRENSTLVTAPNGDIVGLTTSKPIIFKRSKLHHLALDVGVEESFSPTIKQGRVMTDTEVAAAEKLQKR